MESNERMTTKSQNGIKPFVDIERDIKQENDQTDESHVIGMRHEAKHYVKKTRNRAVFDFVRGTKKSLQSDSLSFTSIKAEVENVSHSLDTFLKHKLHPYVNKCSDFEQFKSTVNQVTGDIVGTFIAGFVDDLRKKSVSGEQCDSSEKNQQPPIKVVKVESVSAVRRSSETSVVPAELKHSQDRGTSVADSGKNYQPSDYLSKSYSSSESSSLSSSFFSPFRSNSLRDQPLFKQVNVETTIKENCAPSVKVGKVFNEKPSQAVKENYELCDASYRLNSPSEAGSFLSDSMIQAATVFSENKEGHSHISLVKPILECAQGDKPYDHSELKPAIELHESSKERDNQSQSSLTKRRSKSDNAPDNEIKIEPISAVKQEVTFNSDIPEAGESVKAADKYSIKPGDLVKADVQYKQEPGESVKAAGNCTSEPEECSTAIDMYPSEFWELVKAAVKHTSMLGESSKDACNHVPLPGEFAKPAVCVPPDLTCSLCNDLFADAVLVVCCGTSFCDRCARRHLTHSRRCPGCDAENVTDKSIIPNRSLRGLVLKFQEDNERTSSEQIACDITIPPLTPESFPAKLPPPSMSFPAPFSLPLDDASVHNSQKSDTNASLGSGQSQPNPSLFDKFSPLQQTEHLPSCSTSNSLPIQQQSGHIPPHSIFDILPTLVHQLESVPFDSLSTLPPQLRPNLPLTRPVLPPTSKHFSTAPFRSPQPVPLRPIRAAFSAQMPPIPLRQRPFFTAASTSTTAGMPRSQSIGGHFSPRFSHPNRFSSTTTINDQLRSTFKEWICVQAQRTVTSSLMTGYEDVELTRARVRLHGVALAFVGVSVPSDDQFRWAAGSLRDFEMLRIRKLAAYKFQSNTELANSVYLRFVLQRLDSALHEKFKLVALTPIRSSSEFLSFQLRLKELTNAALLTPDVVTHLSYSKPSFDTLCRLQISDSDLQF